MYSEYWIDKYGEDEIYDHIRNYGDVKLTSHDEEETNFSFAIENYLVKYRNSNDPFVNEYIDHLFNSFYQNPLYYAYSYILSNDLIVKSLTSNNEKRKKLYEAGKNRLVYGWNDTYKKLMNDEPVNINDKNKLIVLFTRGIRNGDKKHKEIIEKYIYKLLQENKIPDNDFEKLLLFNYASRFTLGTKYNMVDTFIKLGDIPDEDDCFTGGYQKEAYILMNDHPSTFSFYESLDQMIQCCCHETTHAIQEQQAINEPNNVHAMEMAIQKIFAFDEYKTGDNYLFNEIEEDAQRNGYWVAELIYQCAKRRDIANKLLKEKLKYIKERKFQYEYVTINENGKKTVVSKEKYNVKNIREIVKKNKDLIKKYPVLTNLFDKQGNHKSLEKMLSEDFKSHDIRSMYTDFIIYDIRHDELNNIDLTNKDEKYKYNVLSNLCNILNTFVDKATDVIKDCDYRKNNYKKTIFFYKIYIEDIIRIADYVEKELPFMRDYEKRHPGNYNLYSSYTMSMRYLLNTIENYRNKNELTNLERTTNKYKDKLDRYDLNIKNEYMDYILEHFTSNERCSLLKINDNYMSLEKFVRVELMSHMNREHYLYDNNGRIMLKDNGEIITPIELTRMVLNHYKVYGLDDMLSEKENINEDNKKHLI